MVQILDHRGKPFPRGRVGSRPRHVRASYDAAAVSDDSRKHWANADSLSANAANDKSTRQTLRDRARYECANNSHAAGLIDELTDATIGTGPRLQLTIPGADRTVTREIERLFTAWADQINLAEKLRVANKTKIRDGEVFGLQVTNPKLDPFLPQLDLKLYEAEQVADPYWTPLDPKHVDGIVYDDFGNVEAYQLLKAHPGSDYGWMGMSYDTIPAERMCHWFRPDRPGQSRGLPEIMPALPLFAQLRRMTLAVITAAEFAACISGVMESDQAPDYQGSDTQEGDEPEFDRVELERGGLLTVPKGWKAKGFETNQPFATFGDFRAEILNETGRPVQAPGTTVSGDYSKLNYSSGRLARLPLQQSIKVRRTCCRRRVLDPFVFKPWLREAFLMGVLPAGLPPIAFWSWQWFWDGFASVDPQKEATASQTELETFQKTYAEHYAEKNQDWQEAFEQIGREQAMLKQLGINKVPPPAPAPQPEEEEVAV